LFACSVRAVTAMRASVREPPEHILDQIVSGFEQPQRARRIADRGQAIDEIVAAAAPEDMVLVAGKGHEDYQETAGQRLDFSDRERVRQALRRRVS
jgi:UDP-N-acetylmuramyl tripeptide synthase